MENINAIEVKDIKKHFKVYYDKGGQLKERILFRKRSRYEQREVLKGVSFTVKRGEAVGLIGHNGCGKSTTLKLLTRIMYPDSGSITMNGRVSSLIELGAGFHPDMSGRENIYTNAAIFGLTKKEIDARLKEIIAFSELEEFIDNPVRTYSSGMYMRLAFSVAINVNADILLIDEILAVGDTNFQTKCFKRLRELKASGITIIIVTHDLGTIEKFCDRAIWLNDGYVVKDDKSASVVDAYFSFMNDKKVESVQREQEYEKEKNVEKEEEPAEEQSTEGNSEEDEKDSIDYSSNHFGLRYAEITEASIYDVETGVKNILHSGKPVNISISYKVNRMLDEFVFGMGFFTIEGECIYGNNTQLDRLTVKANESGTVVMEIPSFPLIAGQYILNVSIVDKDGTPLDFYRNYCGFDVVSEDRSEGLISVKHNWRTE